MVRLGRWRIAGSTRESRVHLAIAVRGSHASNGAKRGAASSVEIDALSLQHCDCALKHLRLVKFSRHKNGSTRSDSL